MDDYLIIRAPDTDECENSLATLLATFNHLGLPVALDKMEGSVPCLKFLGFKLDSRSMAIRLPAAKLAESQKVIQDCQDKKSSTKKELEALGHIKLIF